MSIPSVNFRRSPGPVRRGPVSPGIQRNRNIQPKPVVNLEFSSSSSDYYSDDIPTITTVAKGSSKPILLSSESLSDEYEYENELIPIQTSEADWKSAPKNDDPIKKQLKSPPTRRKPQKTEIRPMFTANHTFTGPNKPQNLQIEVPNPVKSSNNQKSPRIQIDDFEISSNEEEEVSEHILNGVPLSPKSRISVPFANDENAANEQSQTQNNQNDVQDSQNQGQIQTFDVYKEKKSFSRKVGEFRLSENGQIKYFASPSKDFKGQIFAITTSQPATLTNSDFVGFVRIKSSKKSSSSSAGISFAVVTKDQKFNDDREGELCALGVISSTANSKNKIFRMICPSNGKPHYPISKRRSLLSIANYNNNANSNSNSGKSLRLNDTFLRKFDFYDSEGTPDFGNFFVMQSAKNFRINNKEGGLLFMFFKMAESSYKVQFAPPLTQFMAFGLAIAVASAVK